jgi:hypothetical protein
MRATALVTVLAVAGAALLGACGGSSPEAGKTATAQPSSMTVVPANGAPAATAEAPAAGPATVPVANARPNPTPAPQALGAHAATSTSTAAPGSSAKPARRATSAPTQKPGARKRTTPVHTRPTGAAWEPSSLQPSADLASWQLLDAWAAGNRARALEDASPAAVSALFSHTFPAGGLQFRGCSSPPGNTPATCVFRDGNDLVSLTSSVFPHGWAVTGAVLES